MEVQNIITEFSIDSESLARPRLRHFNCILSVVMNLRKLKDAILNLTFHSFKIIYRSFSSLSERYVMKAAAINELVG